MELLGYCVCHGTGEYQLVVVASQLLLSYYNWSAFVTNWKKSVVEDSLEPFCFYWLFNDPFNFIKVVTGRKVGRRSHTPNGEVVRVDSHITDLGVDPRAIVLAAHGAVPLSNADSLWFIFSLIDTLIYMYAI